MLKQVFIFLIATLLFNLLPIEAKEKTFTEAVKKEEKNSEVNVKWTESLKLKDFPLSTEVTELGDGHKAYISSLEENYKKIPSGFGIAIPYGLALIDIGELEKAEAVWERALKDFSNNPTPKVYRAWVYARKGDYESAKNLWLPIAEERLTLGLEAPVWFSYHTHATLGLYLIKDYLPSEEAKEIKELVFRIVELYKNTPNFASVLAIEDLRNGKLDSADSKLTSVLNNHPNDSVSIILSGISQLLRGNSKEAIEFFDRASEIYSISPTNQLMKARALFAMNKKKESKAIINKLKKAEGDMSKLLDARSYIVPLESKPEEDSKTKAEVPN